MSDLTKYMETLSAGAPRFGAWFRINYNLAQLSRMVASNHPLYQQTADIRMVVYGAADLWFGYFTLREIEWTGDKAAVRYLTEHDPQFLSAFREFIGNSRTRTEKFAAYQKAAAMAAAPLGGIWPLNATVMNLRESAGIMC